MNAALKGASTSFSGHITIYSELNSYEVKHVLNKFNFPGACDETNIISKMNDFCIYIYKKPEATFPVNLYLFTLHKKASIWLSSPLGKVKTRIYSQAK